MGLFDFFKKDLGYKLPEIYEGLININEYNTIIEFSKKYHAENNLKILSIGNGEIVIEIDNQEQYRYLDNLVRVLASNEINDWEGIVYNHFDRLKETKGAYEYLFKDFEYANQFLRVLIKDSSFNLDEEFENSGIIFRTDLPETNTFLVLEFENKFRYINFVNIADWNVSIEELFEIAIANTPDEEIEVKELLCDDKFTVYAFFSGDYSASLMLDLENRYDFAIGLFGSLIAIPTKGTAIVYPVASNNVQEMIQILNPSIEQFYKEDPGQISTNFYWLYQNKFKLIEQGENKDGENIILPIDLKRLMHNA